jgi:uroporphyrinogen III methyltransferase/synthase
MISGNLKNIAKLARKNNLEAPALFVIGDAVSLRKYIYKASRKPLRGKRIMVTRAGDQAETMSRRLRILGAEVISLPTIRTVENFSEESWKVFKKIKDGWLIFTSENGVKYFFRQFFREGFDIRYLANFKIAVIGEGTEGALRTHRLRADFRSKNFTLQSLTDGLLNNYKWQGVKVVRVRSDISEIELEIALSEAGAEILPLTLYKTLPAKWDSGMITAFSEGKIDAVTFTSASTVNGLVEIIGADKFKDFGKKTAVISIGPSTTSSLRKYGVEPSAQAEVHSIAGVIKAILTFFK